MPPLKVFVFGPPRVELGDQIVEISLRKALALFVYLAVTRQPHSRDSLATLFWPESNQGSGRASLRRTLYRLNQALGEHVLHASAESIAFNLRTPLWLDVEAYREHLDACLPTNQPTIYLTNQLSNQPTHNPTTHLTPQCVTRLISAVELYGADFLAGFTLPDTPAFDEWQFFQREELRRSLAQALVQLVHVYQARREFEQAILFGRRWLALDPLHEPAQRQLMQLYAWSGQQAAALRQYEECARLLKEELGVEPEAETTALYETIRARRLGMPAGVPGREPPSKRDEGLLMAEGGLLPEKRYVLEEVLATGGHGEVYRGRDRQTGQTVAIKRLRPDLVRREPDFVARFIREGEALRRLNHPNIVCMLDAFEEAGQHHIVMEYVPAGSLRALLDEEPQLPLAQVLEIALELADALMRAHHLRIIHRDIKPENVLLATDGAPRLTDFGIARLEREDAPLTPTGSLLGSPAYMSPEALRGEELDARSDIWSFGALLYEMLAGRRPFAGEHITAVIANVLNDRPPEVERFRPDVPAPLANLLRRMLVKEREERIPTMRQVAAELEAIRAGEQGGGGAEGKISPAATLARPQTHYVRSGDVHIAYQVLGEGPVDLVFVGGFVSHLEQAWEEPGLTQFMQRLAAFSRLIIFDKRGMGLSERVGYSPCLDHTMDDILAVMDAANSQRAVLFGVSEGGPNSILFAATYPDRVIALILYGTMAKFTRTADYPWALTTRQWDAWLNRLIDNWGNPTSIEYFAPSRVHDAAFLAWWAQLLRLGSSPAGVKSVLEVARDIDVRHVLPAVRVPTLVLHRAGDKAMPAEGGRYLAQHIQSAQYVELDGIDHWWWVGDTEAILVEIELFLQGITEPELLDRMLATILFIEMTGDNGVEARERVYRSLVRREVERFRGREIKEDGRRFLAIFDGPSRALACVQAIRNAARPLDVTIRAGLHTGECEFVNGQLRGVAVQIAAGVLERSAPGEILLSRTVIDLVVGAGFTFEDHGRHLLDGISAGWRLFALKR